MPYILLKSETKFLNKGNKFLGRELSSEVEFEPVNAEDIGAYFDSDVFSTNPEPVKIPQNLFEAVRKLNDVGNLYDFMNDITELAIEAGADDETISNHELTMERLDGKIMLFNMGLKLVYSNPNPDIIYPNENGDYVLTIRNDSGKIWENKDNVQLFIINLSNCLTSSNETKIIEPTNVKPTYIEAEVPSIHANNACLLVLIADQ